MAEQQLDRKPDTTITAAKIALIGTIAAAFIGAAATVTVALLQRGDSASTTENSATTSPTSTTTEDLPTKVFDESALEGDDGIKKILVDDYKVQVESVDCPADQEVRAGTKFTCIVQLGEDNSRELAVTITVVNDSGTYQVGLPEER